MIDRASFVRRAFFVLAIGGVNACTCRARKSPDPEPTAIEAPATTTSGVPGVSGYGALVGAIREAGLSDEGECETPPATKSELERNTKMREHMRSSFPEMGDEDKLSLADLSKKEDRIFASALDTRIDDQSLVVGTLGLSKAQRAIYFHALMEGEVNNGGFHQFFSNSTGDCAMQVLEAERTIGHPKTLVIYEHALSLFPSSRPAADRKTRNDQMASVPNEFAAWRNDDDAFYAQKDRPSAIAKFARAHLAELSPPPSDGGSREAR